MKTTENDKDAIVEHGKYNKLVKLRCRIKNDYVYHGLTDKGDVQTITCLSCGDTYKFHIDCKNRVELSLWEYYNKIGKDMDLTPKSNVKPKNRWNPKKLFIRG